MSAARFGAGVVLLVLAILGNASAEESYSSPVSPGTFAGLAQAPEANLFTGNATTSIPIEVPQGRRGLTPKLALVYNSAVKHSPYGYGWDLPLGSIQRSTKHGVLSCTDGTYRDDFVLSLPGSTIECALGPATSGVRTCVPLVQEAPLRIHYFENGNSWEVTDISGIRYRFGEYDEARTGSNTRYIFALNPPPATTLCAYTASWGMTSLADTNGNSVEYTYRKTFNGENTNVLHPERIAYGANPSAGMSNDPFEVLFLWEGDNDEIVQGQSALGWSKGTGGGLARVKRILREVVVQAPGASPFLRRYLLSYDKHTTPTDEFNEIYDANRWARLLTAVELFGPDLANPSNVEGIPLPGADGTATLLSYRTPSDVGVFGPVSTFSRECLGISASTPGVARWQGDVATSGEVKLRDVIDMTGDGIADLVDIVQVPCAVSNCYQASGSMCHRWTVYPGGPGGWDVSRKFDWELPIRMGTDPVYGDCYFQPYTWGLERRKEVSSAPKIFDVTSRVADINGDGIPDLIAESANASENVWEVFYGFFDPVSGHGGFLLDESNPITIGLDFSVNGGFSSWPAPSGARMERSRNMSASSFLPAWAGKGTWTEYALIDMNADGLPDLVQGKGVDAGAGGFRVWYNNKTGFDVEPVDIWAQYGMISLTINHSNAQNVLIESRTVLNLIDFNGDGLPDQVAARGANAPYGYWDVYPNVGHAMAQRFPVAVFGALSLTTYNQNEKRVVRDLLDVDGDGCRI